MISGWSSRDTLIVGLLWFADLQVFRVYRLSDSVIDAALVIVFFAVAAIGTTLGILERYISKSIDDIQKRGGL